MKIKISNSRTSILKLTWLYLLSAVFMSGCTSITSTPIQPVEDVACKDKSEQEIAELRGISLSTLHLLRKHRSLFKEDICVISEKKLARAIYRSNTPKPDEPDKAIAFRNMQLQDESGLIPEDGLQKALEHVRTMRSDLSLSSTLFTSGAGIARGNWQSIGPGNIGGRIRSIIFHPNDPDTIWVGSVSGGVWKTTNAGQSWSEVDDFMANLAVSTLVINPTNPNIMYAGTGEGFYNGDGIRGAGIFKSTNGGATWNQLPATANNNWYYVNRLSISPTSNSTLLAATRSGIWRSINAGNTWSQVSTQADVYDIDFHPTDGTKAIAGGDNGTYYSTNSGASWQSASGITNQSFDRSEVTYAASNPDIVYASVDLNGGEIWKSTNGGQSYSQVNTGNSYLGSQGWYDNIIWVDPTNPNTVIVGGIDLWRSNNGGTSLTKISQWFSSASVHADHHYILAHPNFNGSTNKTVYFANDGGIYRTSDVYTAQDSSGWEVLNNSLRITQFYGAAGNPTSGKIVGGTQDNGTLLYSGDADGWGSMNGGDGGFCAADPTDPNYFYGEFQYLQIHRSTNGGQSSSLIVDGLGDSGQGNDNNFISPYILDPNNPNTMLAGGGSLWRSSNVKAPTPQWISIKSPITGGSNISAIAIAQDNSNIIWVGYNSGAVYKTTNGTAANPIWMRMDDNGVGLPNRYVHRIAIDPSNSNTVYVTFGGFRGDNIFRSADGGLSWADRTGIGVTGLPDVPVRSLVVSQTTPEYIYAGTEIGIFASEDAGLSWGLPHDGPANVSVDELFWLDANTLVAATHGRGLFTQQVIDVSDYSESLDYQSNWSSGGDAIFVNGTTEYFYDEDSVHSGRIVHEQSSHIETQLTGPGTLKFYWKVSSEPGYDFFKLLVDGEEMTNISGEVNWIKYETQLDAGQHDVRWVYEKDTSVNTGADRAWLDKVEYQPGASAISIIPMLQLLLFDEK